MRIPTTIFCFLLSLAPAFSQTQEAQVQSRLSNAKNPDLSLGSAFQNETYKDGGSLSFRAAPGAKSQFSDTKHAYVRDFAFTRTFLGVKNPWFGKKVYDTKNAALWSRSLFNAEKEVPVKKAEISGFYDASRQANLGDSVVPVRGLIPKGHAQGAVDKITDKIKKEMTIDEVRELLNKPR